MSTSRIARALPVLRALSQRAITTQSQSSITAADQIAVTRALAAAVAISRKAPPVASKSSAAQFSAITHQEMARKVEHQLQAQMAVVEASSAQARAGQAMEAAADHLRGIPLKSNHEYKSLMAGYNAKRS